MTGSLLSLEPLASMKCTSYNVGIQKTQTFNCLLKWSEFLARHETSMNTELTNEEDEQPLSTSGRMRKWDQNCETFPCIPTGNYEFTIFFSGNKIVWVYWFHVLTGASTHWKILFFLFYKKHYNCDHISDVCIYHYWINFWNSIIKPQLTKLVQSHCLWGWVWDVAELWWESWNLTLSLLMTH